MFAFAANTRDGMFKAASETGGIWGRNDQGKQAGAIFQMSIVL